VTESSTGPAPRLRCFEPLALAIAGAILVGSVILVLGMIEEPYHIDELRQVRAYPRPVAQVIDLSFGQEQPPLDSLIGKAVYEIVGQGHIRQRLHPTILGMVSLGLFAWLLWRAGLRWAVPVAVLVYSIVPIVVSMTAYARQYSLPVFLWLVFLNGAELWLRRRSWLGFGAAMGAAVLLPLSRSIDPVIFLVAAAAALVGWRVTGRLGSVAGSPLPLIGVTLASVAVVGIPVVLRIRSEAAEFIAPAAGLGERMTRLVTDLPAALAESSTAWPVATAVVVLAIASPRVRRFAAEAWWFWPLVLVPVGFASAFFLLANTGQPFFHRYTYSWWIPFAILSGLIIEEAVDTASEGTAGLRYLVGAAAVGLTALFLAGALARDLTSDDWTDYEPLGALITSELERDVAVYFDNLRPLGLYRPGYAGYGRFTKHQVPLTLSVIRDPFTVDADAPFVVALNGPALDVPGWEPVYASPNMYLYLPDTIPSGHLAAAATLLEFGRALDADTGGTLRLAGASLLLAAGQPETACDEVELLLSEDLSLTETVDRVIAGHPLADAVEVCGAG